MTLGFPERLFRWRGRITAGALTPLLHPRGCGGQLSTATARRGGPGRRSPLARRPGSRQGRPTAADVAHCVVGTAKRNPTGPVLGSAAGSADRPQPGWHSRSGPELRKGAAASAPLGLEVGAVGRSCELPPPAVGCMPRIRRVPSTIREGRRGQCPIHHVFRSAVTGCSR